VIGGEDCGFCIDYEALECAGGFPRAAKKKNYCDRVHVFYLRCYTRFNHQGATGKIKLLSNQELRQELSEAITNVLLSTGFSSIYLMYRAIVKSSLRVFQSSSCESA